MKVPRSSYLGCHKSTKCINTVADCLRMHSFNICWGMTNKSPKEQLADVLSLILICSPPQNIIIMKENQKSFNSVGILSTLLTMTTYYLMEWYVHKMRISLDVTAIISIFKRLTVNWYTKVSEEQSGCNKSTTMYQYSCRLFITVADSSCIQCLT